MIYALAAYVAISGVALIGIAVEQRRYTRLRWAYYRDQRRLAKLRWERETAFRG